jgi:hypothetical protein
MKTGGNPFKMFKMALGWMLILSSAISACGGIPAAPPRTGTQPPIYIPPTQLPALPTPTRLPLTTPIELRPAATPACTNQLAFQVDLSVPDGSQVAPGETLDKRWEVENSGTCNWDDRYSLRLVAGNELGAKPQMGLYPARSGTVAPIQILFTAPQEPGPYRSAWQAYGPDGEAFGDQIFIDILVNEPE